MTDQQSNDQQDDQFERDRQVAEAARDAEYRAEYQAAFETAVEALTTAARMKHPRYGQLDWAEFVTNALAAAAANLGSIDAVLAGRPGSWEAGKVEGLLRCTVGWDDEYLIGHRTEPVVIQLDVDQYLEETAPRFVSPYWLERDALDAEFGEIFTEEDDDAYQQRLEALEQRWRQAYAGYAEAFTTAVQAEAATIPELRVPVTITTISDPDPAYPRLEHPTEGWGTDADPLVWRLWQAGVRAIQAALPAQDTDGAPS